MGFLFLAMLVMPVSMVLDTTESVMLMLSSLMLVSMEPTDILLLMALLLLPLVLPIPPMLESAITLSELRSPVRILVNLIHSFSRINWHKSEKCKLIFQVSSNTTCIGKCRDDLITE